MWLACECREVRLEAGHAVDGAEEGSLGQAAGVGIVDVLLVDEEDDVLEELLVDQAEHLQEAVGERQHFVRTDPLQIGAESRQECGPVGPLGAGGLQEGGVPSALSHPLHSRDQNRQNVGDARELRGRELFSRLSLTHSLFRSLRRPVASVLEGQEIRGGRDGRGATVVAEPPRSRLVGHQQSETAHQSPVGESVQVTREHERHEARGKVRRVGQAKADDVEEGGSDEGVVGA
mmetsp:Transcript_15005/g.58766  ORF Transcript_15005/g.58766 Transcript_15005/m.58766 type:complete len:233 (+) Transcript_15005:666-1364(+)